MATKTPKREDIELELLLKEIEQSVVRNMKQMDMEELVRLQSAWELINNYLTEYTTREEAEVQYNEMVH